MNKSTRLFLLTVAAAAVTSSVRAYTDGDLLVGFTSPGATNDAIVDIGNVNSLHPGETWNLGGTGVGGNFTPTQFAAAQWGIVGAVSSSRTIFSSEGASGVPQTDPGEYNTIHVGVASLPSLANSIVLVNQGAYNSWYTETDQPNGTPGATLLFNTLDNPNVGTGQIALLFGNDNLGDPAFYDGNFTVSSDGSTLTYVPEPGVLSLWSGFGLLALVVRRALTSKGRMN